MPIASSHPCRVFLLAALLTSGTGTGGAAQPPSLNWEVLVDLPAEQAWLAVASSTGLGQWLSARAEVDLTAGRGAIDLGGGRYAATIDHVAAGQVMRFVVDQVPAGENGAALRGTQWLLSLTRVSPASTMVRLVVQPPGPDTARLRQLLKYPVLLALTRLRLTTAP